jgi:hypothetical protein
MPQALACATRSGSVYGSLTLSGGSLRLCLGLQA